MLLTHKYYLVLILFYLVLCFRPQHLNSIENHILNRLITFIKLIRVFKNYNFLGETSKYVFVISRDELWVVSCAELCRCRARCQECFWSSSQTQADGSNRWQEDRISSGSSRQWKGIREVTLKEAWKWSQDTNCHDVHTTKSCVIKLEDW